MLRDRHEVGSNTMAKKKTSRTRAAASKPKRLKKVPAKDYKLLWDPSREQCHFGHKSGIGGPVGCGVCDVVEVFCAGKKYYVLSLNYVVPYACLEAFVDTKGVQSLVFAEPGDMRKIFGDDLSGVAPKKIAEQLAGMV